MKILQIGEPILEQPTEKVVNFDDPNVKNLIRNMEEEVRQDEESAGLAAPQVGKSLAITVVKVIIPENDSSGPETLTLINPKVIKSSTDKSIFWEGCMSVGVGEDRLFGPVKRPSSVTIEYQDKKGDKQTLEAHGYFAHIVQHEVDHLEGILFVQYVTDPQNLWKNKDLDKYIEENGGFPPVVGEKMAVPEMIVD